MTPSPVPEQYTRRYSIPPPPRENRGCWQICHISGQFSFRQGGFSFSGRIPLILVCPPRLSFFLAGTGHCSRILLDDDGLQALLINPLYIKAPGASLKPHKIHLYPLSGEMETLRERQEGTSSDLRREIGLLEYLIRLKSLSEFRREELVRPESSPWTVRDVEEHIRSHYDSPMSLDELAARCALNASYLSRSFKARTGSTIFGLLNRVRIEKACSLLKESSLSIIDIAFSIGYNNLSFFNRSFKKYTGRTPGEYRRHIRG